MPGEDNDSTSVRQGSQADYSRSERKLGRTHPIVSCQVNIRPVLRTFKKQVYKGGHTQEGTRASRIDPMIIVTAIKEPKILTNNRTSAFKPRQFLE
jgi:hypothetical protein